MTNIKFWKGGDITSMTGNNIFVYGANPEFRNGWGAAKVARNFGAKPYGSGRGIVGNTFGLITKNLKAGYVEAATGIKYDIEGERSVSPEMISDNIDELYQCALDNPDKKFFVAYKNSSRNLNGYTPKEMWELFTNNKYVPENIRFHESFKMFLGQTNNLAHASQDKREGVRKLNELYEMTKKGIVKNTSENNKAVKSNSENKPVDYQEAIKIDNQPRKNFTFFWHSLSPFSQWHPSKFVVKNITFTSCEQFMMYCKAKLFKDEQIAEEILALNMSERIIYDDNGKNIGKEATVLKKFYAGEITAQEILSDPKLKEEWDSFQKKIKALGRKVKNYDDELWVKHRVSYVAKGNYEKYSQNESLKQELLNTKNTIMVESNPFDKIWAMGIYENDHNATSPSKWKGLNLLGHILTNLREKFKLDLKNEHKKENDKPKQKMKP